MRSISASTCAISSSAFGESVRLVSAAPGASAPSTAITATGPSTTPVIKAFIQRDLVILDLHRPPDARGVHTTIQCRVAASFGPENRGASPPRIRAAGRRPLDQAHPNAAIEAVVPCWPLRTANG